MMWITFVILIVIVFFASVKYFKKNGTNILSGESALDILKSGRVLVWTARHDG